MASKLVTQNDDQKRLFIVKFWDNMGDETRINITYILTKRKFKPSTVMQAWATHNGYRLQLTDGFDEFAEGQVNKDGRGYKIQVSDAKECNSEVMLLSD